MELSSSKFKALAVSAGFSFWFFIISNAIGIFSIELMASFVAIIIIVTQIFAVKLSKLLDRAITLGRKIKGKKLVDFRKVIIRYLNNEYNENEIMDVVELQQIKKDVIQFSEQFPFHYKL